MHANNALKRYDQELKFGLSLKGENTVICFRFIREAET